MSFDHTFLRRLRVLGIVEGISTLVLFGIAMPLKYLGDMPMAVTVVGSVHGLLFMGLVAMFILGLRMIPLHPALATAGIVGAVIPFGPFVVDHWLGRHGAAARAAEATRATSDTAASTTGPGVDQAA